MSRKNDELKSKLKATRTKGNSYKASDLLSTGSKLLDLGCSGRTIGGWPKGHYIYLVGDTSSGKTFLTMTCLAEAAQNPNFDNYRFIYDNTENGLLIDIKKFFGQDVEDRLEPPAGTKEEPIYSETTDDFYFNLDDAFEVGKPFIYILDSMDALLTHDEMDKFKEEKTAHKKGKEATGTFGVSKAKQNSNRIRMVMSKLKKTGSILIVISQTRDTIGFGAMFNPKTRGGGRALSFYAHLEIWSAVKKKIKKPVKGKDRVVGIESVLTINKNRLTGWTGKISMPIYRSYGIDDIGSCVDFLVEEGHWPKTKGGLITATDITGEESRPMKRDDLISLIEEQDLQINLYQTLQNVWRQIEDESKLKRKPKYGAE